jgi:hypothetical protein
MSEPDSSAALLKSRATKLAALMATGEEGGHLWRADELAAMFRHQLSAPILLDLGSFDPRTANRLRNLSEAQGLLLKSFADLFQHPSPAKELLETVKEFAKAHMDHPESGLPAAIATALYYTSIAAALVHLNERISKLSDTDLQNGLRWAQQQSWLDENTKDLLAKASDKISGGKGSVAP